MSIVVEMDTSEAMGKLDAILRNFETAPTVIEQDVTNAVDLIVETAKALVPVKTGNLQASIRWEGEFPNFMIIADAVSPQGFGYAPAVEYGTSMQRAQPYIWPAVQTVRAQLVPMLRQNFRNAVLGV